MRRNPAIVVLLLMVCAAAPEASAASEAALPCHGSLVADTGTCGIAPQLDGLQPVSYSPGAVVPVSGRGVRVGEQVGIDGQWAPIQAIAGGGLGFALPATVRAGASVVQLGDGEPPVPFAGARPQPLTVRPAVTSAIAESGRVQIVMAPAVEADQSVALSLVSTDVSSGPADSVRVVVSSPTATSEFTFPLPTTIPPGEYLATVAVNGASSVPRYDAGSYTGPLVQIG